MRPVWEHGLGKRAVVDVKPRPPGIRRALDVVRDGTVSPTGVAVAAEGGQDGGH